MKLPDDDLINKVKRKEKRGRSKNVGRHGDSTEIPLDLYKSIMEANTFRKKLETNPNDKHSLAMLAAFESQVPIYVDFYKDSKFLPRGWKYDPATVGFLVPKKSLVLTDSDIIISDSPKRHGFSPPPYDPSDPNQKYPDTELVLMNDEQKKVWLQFLKYTKETLSWTWVLFPFILGLSLLITGDSLAPGRIG
uniref:uncharacterized protein LOC122594415 n=1 Tax=Erigeron canadensis TaxID=72917 RepID=UPI001CB8D858|nr:uncharacterized protein LOC122594415 [Erigeron canadensis]